MPSVSRRSWPSSRLSVWYALRPIDELEVQLFLKEELRRRSGHLPPPSSAAYIRDTFRRSDRDMSEQKLNLLLPAYCAVLGAAVTVGRVRGMRNGGLESQAFQRGRDFGGRQD